MGTVVEVITVFEIQMQHATVRRLTAMWGEDSIIKVSMATAERGRHGCCLLFPVVSGWSWLLAVVRSPKLATRKLATRRNKKAEERENNSRYDSMSRIIYLWYQSSYVANLSRWFQLKKNPMSKIPYLQEPPLLNLNRYMTHDTR